MHPGLIQTAQQVRLEPASSRTFDVDALRKTNNSRRVIQLSQLVIRNESAVACLVGSQQDLHLILGRLKLI
jgi:hypothetical protein